MVRLILLWLIESLNTPHPYNVYYHGPLDYHNSGQVLFQQRLLCQWLLHRRVRIGQIAVFPQPLLC